MLVSFWSQTHRGTYVDTEGPDVDGVRPWVAEQLLWGDHLVRCEDWGIGVDVVRAHG